MSKQAKPLPDSYLETVFKNIFGPLSNCDCSTALFAPGGGKRTILSYLLNNDQLLKKAMGKGQESTLLVYVNPDNLLETTNSSYLQLMYEGLVHELEKKNVTLQSEPSKNPLQTIKNAVKELTDKGVTIAFVLHDFEIVMLNLTRSIFLNLESIMTVNKSHTTFIFLASTNVFSPDYTKKLHNLKYAVSQNVYYFPLFTHKNRQYVLESLVKKLCKPVSSAVKELLENLYGGHPQLLKYSLSNLSNAGKNYLKDPKKAREKLERDKQIKMIMFDIWDNISPQEQSILIGIVRNGKIPADLKSQAGYLIGTGIISISKDNKPTIFGEGLVEYVKEQIPKEKLMFDAKNNQIFFGMEKVGDAFTSQEFKLLTHFLEHEGKIVTRDEVGDVIWGSNADDKYSDWHIDKLISTIRKKLETIGFPGKKLSTLKGRGFRFAN